MTASLGQDSSYWLSSPLVASGTATSGCSGRFRTAAAVDVVLDCQHELLVLSATPEGVLETVFRQPLFCRLRQLCVLPFSLLQQQNTQTQASCSGRPLVLNEGTGWWGWCLLGGAWTITGASCLVATF